MSLIKTPEEIQIMAEGGKILATVLNEIAKMAKPGITTLELDRAAEALILKHGRVASGRESSLRSKDSRPRVSSFAGTPDLAKPAFKGYENFPYSLCASVNDVIVHGFPSNYKLKEGDIVGLDLGVLHKGYNTDMAVTVAVGKVSFEAKRLLMVTKKALKRGIKKAKVGNTTGDVGNTIQRYIESQGYGVVRDLCGHGIGREIHEDPKIPNYGKRGTGEKLLEGMVICIEPMVTMGDWHLKKASDGYGYATKDGSLAAHFEQTIAITKDGPKVLTEI